MSVRFLNCEHIEDIEIDGKPYIEVTFADGSKKRMAGGRGRATADEMILAMTYDTAHEGEEPYPRLRLAMCEALAKNHVKGHIEGAYNVLGIDPADYDHTERWTAETVKEIARQSGRSVAYLMEEEV